MNEHLHKAPSGFEVDAMRDWTTKVPSIIIAEHDGPPPYGVGETMAWSGGYWRCVEIDGNVATWHPIDRYDSAVFAQPAPWEKIDTL